MLSSSRFLLDLGEHRTHRAVLWHGRAARRQATAIRLLLLRDQHAWRVLSHTSEISVLHLLDGDRVWCDLLFAAAHLYVGNEFQRYDLLPFCSDLDLPDDGRSGTRSYSVASFAPKHHF